MNKRHRKLHLEDVKSEEWYSLHEISLMLNVVHSTMSRRCHSWLIKATNIWTEKKAQFRILWKDLLKYLNRKNEVETSPTLDNFVSIEVIIDWKTEKLTDEKMLEFLKNIT